MYSSSSCLTPCPAFPASIAYQDVEPDVLAREEESEARRAARFGAGHWQTYLHRVLPALEQDAADDMARALLAAGTGIVASRSHAESMRRRAIASGSVRRARFWADVAREIDRARQG
jgi:hypothetical protein